MKKAIACLLVLLTVLSIVPISASATSATMTVKIGSAAVVFPDQKPVVKNNRTLVPIRFVAEALGYKVDWNPKDNTAVIDNGKIILYIGTNKAVINGKSVTLDVKSEIIGDRTMVPLRVIAETLGCTVDYFGTNQTALVTKRNADGTEKSVFERYKNSGLFWNFKSGENEYLVWKGHYKTLAEASSPSNYYRWWIERPLDMSTLVNQSHDCAIAIQSLTKEDLAQIKDMFYTVYPTQYETAYDYLMKTAKGELWETFYPFTSEWYPLFSAVSTRSGTFGTHYLDNREVEMYCNYNGTRTTVNINREGYVNPETPEILTASEIQSYTKDAKNRYCLEQWGLN